MAYSFGELEYRVAVGIVEYHQVNRKTAPAKFAIRIWEQIGNPLNHFEVEAHIPGVQISTKVALKQ